MALFKYTNHFGVNVLRDLQLKVTPPKELNDPFELNPYFSGQVTQEHVVETMKSFTPRGFYNDRVKAGEKLPPFEQYEVDLQRIAPLLLKHGVQGLQQAYEQWPAKHLDWINERMGLICLSEEKNHPLLWSHYTDGHKGMVLEFDTGHEYFKQFSKFQRVTYDNKRVPIDLTLPSTDFDLENDVRRIIYTKNDCWGYENEWRSLFQLEICHRMPDDRDTHKILFFTDIPPDLISNVYLGLRCPPDIQDKVIAAKNERDLPFKLFEASLLPKEFGVEYKLI
jgi:hypothetical protein